MELIAVVPRHLAQVIHVVDVAVGIIHGNFRIQIVSALGGSGQAVAELGFFVLALLLVMVIS